jgi:TonB family protein
MVSGIVRIGVLACAVACGGARPSVVPPGDEGAGRGDLAGGPEAEIAGLPPEEIRAVVAEKKGLIKACYERGLARDLSLEGTVVAKFVIGEDGAVSSAEEGESTLPDDDVRACVLATIRGLRFPAPESGTVAVTYPFEFNPRD